MMMTGDHQTSWKRSFHFLTKARQVLFKREMLMYNQERKQTAPCIVRPGKKMVARRIHSPLPPPRQLHSAKKWVAPSFRRGVDPGSQGYAARRHKFVLPSDDQRRLNG